MPADADPAKGPVVLNDINEATGGYWVGDLYTKEIALWTDFKGNKGMTAFLPNEEIARKWKETGPALPMTIKLPTDTCDWCGTPTDEPKATPGGMAPNGDRSPAPRTPAPRAAVQRRRQCWRQRYRWQRRQRCPKPTDPVP